MTPLRALDPFDWPAVLGLIRAEFAYMEGRIDPPSSMHRLTEADLAAKARIGEIWVMGPPIRACVVLTPQADSLYIGKLAVDSAHRGRGLARALIGQAERSARARGLAALELETRVELVENQAAFVRMGFYEIARRAHAGFDRPTSVTYRRAVATTDPEIDVG